VTATRFTCFVVKNNAVQYRFLLDHVVVVSKRCWPTCIFIWQIQHWVQATKFYHKSIVLKIL